MAFENVKCCVSVCVCVCVREAREPETSADRVGREPIGDRVGPAARSGAGGLSGGTGGEDSDSDMELIAVTVTVTWILFFIKTNENK